MSEASLRLSPVRVLSALTAWMRGPLFTLLREEWTLFLSFDFPAPVLFIWNESLYKEKKEDGRLLRTCILPQCLCLGWLLLALVY
jgi:hypothetical protein